MTDEEIITLAEKTKEEKYCKENQLLLCKEDPKSFYGCNYECPIAYCDDCETVCGDTIYEQGFLDGFKAAMEYLSKSNKTII